MKKILLLMALILSIGSLKSSLAQLISNLTTRQEGLRSVLTLDKFLSMAFNNFDTKTHGGLGSKYLDNVKAWWNNENNWFTDLFPVEDSISRKAAISLTKAVRAVWFTPKAVISFADNLRKIFFNHSRAQVANKEEKEITILDSILYKTENFSLKSMFSAYAHEDDQIEQILKIAEEVKNKQKGTVSIELIKKAFGAWTKRGALSDLEDALFPKEIRVFQKVDILDGDESKALKVWKVTKNIFKKVFGQLDPFELFYKGNNISNRNLIAKLNSKLKEIYDKFKPELKLAFFKQLSTKNQKLLLAYIKGETNVDNVQGTDIKDYLTELKLAAQPAGTGVEEPLLTARNDYPVGIPEEVPVGITEEVPVGITEEVPVGNLE